WKPVYGQLKRYRVGSLFAFAPAFARKIQEPLLVRGTYSPLNRVTRNRKFEDSPLEERVSCELVSLSEFPVSRELTGNLCRFGSPSAEMAPDNRAISGPYEAIPYALEQGIYFGLTGN